jgi:peptide/nickel transport system ATP-binding protein
MTDRDPMTALLDVRDLRTHFKTDDGEFAAVDGVSFSVDAGRTLAIVGESGCGKSVTSLSIMGLLPKPAGRIAGGSIRFEGRELVGARPNDMQDLRGNGMAMIFQEPMSSLNPVLTIGQQIVEGLLRHRKMSTAQAQARAIEMLRKVRIPAPEQRFHEYPHKLSGGMRQRAMIAMALVCDPRLLIADEPTTALDVTIQAQILDLMRTLQRESGTAIILITHDLGVVAEVADEVVVMYAGRIVERAPVQAIFDAPQHPYTVGLLGSMPRLDGDRARLASIEGQVPSPMRLPAGCRFAERCPFVVAKCRAESPPLREMAAGHASACWRAPLDPAVLMADRAGAPVGAVAA